MGNKQTQATSIKEKEEIGKFIIFTLVINKHSFEFNYVIGKGGFGKVKNKILLYYRYGRFYIKKPKKLSP
jgi:hypothetical protein